MPIIEGSVVRQPRLTGAADPTVNVTGLSLLRACLVAPLAEELLFRGALFGWLRRRLPAWPAILVSAALFWVVIAGFRVLLRLGAVDSSVPLHRRWGF